MTFKMDRPLNSKLIVIIIIVVSFVGYAGRASATDTVYGVRHDKICTKGYRPSMSMAWNT